MLQQRRNNRKWLWWGGGVLVVTLAVAIGVIVWQNNEGGIKDNESGVSDNMVEEEKQKMADKDNGQSDDEKFAEEEVEKKKVTQYEGGDPNVAEELTGAVTYAGVTDGVLMVRVSIDQYLSEGVCELTLVQGGASIYSDTASIVGDVSTATCEGFDVPVGGLGGGNVEININLNADGKSGVIRGEASI